MVTYFVWASRGAHNQIKMWMSPRPGKDTLKLKEYFTGLNVNCCLVEGNKLTLKHLRDLKLKFPKEIIIIRMDKLLTDVDLLDERDKLYEASADGLELKPAQ